MQQFLQVYTYFIIYSFSGWAIESLYCSFLNKKWINRGFISGPFCPIYGFGALAIIAVLHPLTNFFAVFFAGLLITSCIEYFSSYLLEKLFHTTWWDYSDYPFNLNGRVCLKNSILFGVLSITLHFYIHPFISLEVAQLSFTTLGIITLGFTLLFTIDCTETIFSILKLNNRLKSLEEIKSEALARFAEIDFDFGLKAFVEKISELPSIPEQYSLDELYLRFKEIASKLKFSERRLLKAFPRMKNLEIPLLQSVRDFIEEHKKT